MAVALRNDELMAWINSGEREWIHSGFNDNGDSWYLARLPDGSVCLAKTDGKPPGRCEFIRDGFQIPEGHWGSIVLALTMFSERPSDWHAFMDHHHGRVDLLEAAKTLDAVRNIASRLTEVAAKKPV